MLDNVMWFITDCGDVAVLLPVAAVLWAWLMLGRGWRGAAVWTATLGATGLAITILKVCFRLCGTQWLGAPASPSGHSALGVVLYGALTVVAARHLRHPALRRIGTVLAILWVALIAVTRILLHAHTLGEVATGLAVGAPPLWAFYRFYEPPPAPRLSLRWAGVAMILLVALQHGTHAPAENMLIGWVEWLRGMTGVCEV